MKKSILLVLTAFFALSFIACDKNDDKDDDDKGVSVYGGNIEVAIEDADPVTIPDQEISFTNKGDGNVELALKDFKFDMGGTPMNVGTIQLDTKVVDGNITGSVAQYPIMNGAIKADISVAGTLKDGKADLVITVLAPLSPTSVTPVNIGVTFKGTKK